MTGQTAVHHAAERVAVEKSAIAEKVDALETFTERVESLGPTQTSQERATQTVAGSMVTAGVSDKRSTVRSAFAETVAPHAEDDSTLEAVRTELGEGVALALAPTTQAAFTPELRTHLLTATENRRQELAVTVQALGREAEQVESAAATADDLLASLRRADETALSALGFEELRTRHERLSEWDDQLVTAAERRQAFLHGSTSHGGQIGVDNHDLIRSLYEDFSVSHPVLSTVAELQAVLEDCQAVVRDHLVRRA